MLDVEGNIDTGDTCSRIFFSEQIEEKSFTQNITMKCTGFDGKDAEGLKALFRQIFELAGYDRYDRTNYGRA